MYSIIKSLFFTSIFLGFQTAIYAEPLSTKPEKIVSITQKLFEIDYYHEQVDLWNKEILDENDDAYAWMNYYLACRVVNILTKEQNPHDLQKIYKQIELNVKDTYEYHYLTYLNGGGNTALFSHLEKAYDLDPKRTEVLSHLVAYYAIKGEAGKMATYNKLWLESGEISSGILNWNYNALIGLEKNAILLTYGDNDTYPSWMLQQIKGIRTDVKVINIHLLRNQEYIKKVFDECKIMRFPSNKGQIEGSDLLSYVDHIFHYSRRPVYVNVTLPKLIRDKYKDALYTIGLAFKYSETGFDNITSLKNNYENRFLKDYLKVSLSYDKSVTVLNSLNVNYLPAFISLYKHYLKNEKQSKAENINIIIDNIATASGRADEIAAVLERSKNKNRKIDSHINIKTLDKMMMEVTPHLWASETETTNEFYENFLLDLLKEKEFEMLEKCKTNKVDWMSMIAEKFKHLTQEEAYIHANPNDGHVPVINMTYEAAEAYCEWLTIAYNSYSKKKRYKEVLFRLPTEEEWEFAAHAGRPNAPYPWGGFYAVNSKGCYLANFDSSNEPPPQECKYQVADNDGAFFPVTADAYFPNDYGLYNISGNVAEMVQGGKIAKGGSWQDVPEECKISSEKKIEGPSPAIGFRVFMEVISYHE